MANRLFVTGDCHGDIDWHKLTMPAFPEQKNLDREDVVVIMGDAGICWDGGKFDAYCQRWHEGKNYTTLAVAGNHENYDVISRLPIVEKWGGKVYQVTPHVFYTVTGEVYNICGYNCVAINGADSHDKDKRKEGRDWWAAERIKPDDILKAMKNVSKLYYCGEDLDFVFSHTAGAANTRLINPDFIPTDSDILLDYLLYGAEFKMHYFGHMHVDRRVLDRSHCLYIPVYEIIDGKECRQHGVNYKKKENN